MLNHKHFVVKVHAFVICFHRQHACGSSYLGLSPCVACMFSFKLPFKPPFQVSRTEEDVQHSSVLGEAQARDQAGPLFVDSCS